MDRYLKLSFDNVKGRNCEQCMLGFSKGERNHCTALGNRPICPKEGCRKDCPLIDNVVELPVIDLNDERYIEVMTYYNNICTDYTRNDYIDLLKTKDREELLTIQADIKQKIENIKVLHERLSQKKSACKYILDKLK